MPDPRSRTEPRASALRSRKTFRWMPAPVLAHQVPQPEATSGLLPSASFGRGLYARKLAEGVGSTVPPGVMPSAGRELARMPRTLLRWQHPLRYLIVWQGREFTLTWHAPWCRRCDCPGAGWPLCYDAGYLSGLGFELSYARE